MSYLIQEDCRQSLHKGCLDVCPVHCIDFQEDEGYFQIDPKRCIGCGLCVWACPVDAIIHCEIGELG